MGKSKKKRKKMMAMSKAIGVAVMLLTLGVIVYTMWLMAYTADESIKSGVSPDMAPLNTLIGGMFTVAAAYVGFYINMAKSEHIEDKKHEIAKQIRRIEADGKITPEESIQLGGLRNDLENLNGKLDGMSGEEEIKTFLG